MVLDAIAAQIWWPNLGRIGVVGRCRRGDSAIAPYFGHPQFRIRENQKSENTLTLLLRVSSRVDVLATTPEGLIRIWLVSSPFE